MIRINETELRKMISDVLSESEYTDEYIDNYMRSRETMDDGEWLRRNGDWDDRVKYSLGLITRLGEPPRYPSTVEGLDDLATRAKEMRDYYSDPKRATDRSSNLRVRALDRIIRRCEDMISNPQEYVGKQDAAADKAYDKRTEYLRDGDTERIMKTYAYPKDRTEQSDDERDTMRGFDNGSWFPDNFKEKTVVSESEFRGMIAEAIMEALGEKGIHIKEKNRGKFTETMKRTGKPAEELTHSKNPLTRKRANFARMAKRGWKPLKNKD